MKFLPHVTLSVTLTRAVTVPFTVNRIHSDDRSLFHTHQYTTHNNTQHTHRTHNTAHNNTHQYTTHSNTQHTTTRSSTQQHTTVHSSTQQHTTVHSSTQQHTTVHSSTPLQSSLIRLQNITEHLKITIKQTNQSFTPAWP
jgi:hypothetical protein